MKTTLLFHLDQHWDFLFPSFSRGCFNESDRISMIADILEKAWPDIQNAVTVLGLANQGCEQTIAMGKTTQENVSGGLNTNHFKRGQDLIFHAINQMLTAVTPATLPNTDEKHYLNKTINVINPYLLETSDQRLPPILRTSPGSCNVYHIVCNASYGVTYKDVYFDSAQNKVLATRGDSSGIHNFLINNPIRALTWYYNYIVSGFEDPKIRIVEIPNSCAAEVLKRVKPQNNEYTGLRVCDSQSYNSIEFTIDRHSPREKLVYERFIDAFTNLRTVSREAPKTGPDARDGTSYTIEEFLSALGIKSADGYFGMMGGLISSTKMPDSMSDSSSRFERYSKVLFLLETQERLAKQEVGDRKEALLIKTFLDELIWQSVPIIHQLLKMMQKTNQSIVLLHKNNLKDGYDFRLERRYTDNLVLYSVFDYPWYDDVCNLLTNISSTQNLASKAFMTEAMDKHSDKSKAGQSVRYFKGFMAMPTSFELTRPSLPNASSTLTIPSVSTEKWLWRNDMTLLELFGYVFETVKLFKGYRAKLGIPTTTTEKQDCIIETVRTLGLVHTLFRPLHDAVTADDLKLIQAVPQDLKPHNHFTGSVTRKREIYNFQMLADKLVPIGPYTSDHSNADGLPKLFIHQDKYASVGNFKPDTNKYNKLIQQNDLFMGGLSGTTRDELIAVLGLFPQGQEDIRWGFLLSYMGFAYLFKFHSVTEVFHQAANYLVPANAKAKHQKLSAITNLKEPTTYKGTPINGIVDVLASELPKFDKTRLIDSWAITYLQNTKVEIPCHFID
ncbi:MAG: hypothetical protein WC782_13140 [Methylococcaceae bacterium]|jgi:hypothetical protein